MTETRPTWACIADNITHRLDADGLTQQTLAEAVHLSPFQLSNRMRGVYEWRIDELRRVARYLQVSTDELTADETVRGAN